MSLGAFLLFQVQPMMGRRILPVFGGSSAVWMVCLLFFQSLLVVGYAYAFGVSSRLAPRRQGRVHLLLLAGAAAVLFLVGGPGTPAEDSGSPVLRVLALLSLSIGLPYTALASTAPLMQEWFSRVHSGPHPYRWYALSNAAALTALVTYPVLVEPVLSLSAQQRLWSLGFLVYAGSVAWCATGLGAAELVSGSSGSSGRSGASAPAGRMMLWGALAAAGSAMLLATTNQLTQEVASVPLLWMLPLVTYLVTFVICFDREQWYDRRVFGPLLAIAVTLAVIVLGRSPAPDLSIQLVVYLVALYATCMVCHGELVRLRPDPRHLTAFYMAISIGGAVGGLLVAVLAPAIFAGFWEFQVALAACCWIGSLAMLGSGRSAGSRLPAWGRWGVYAAAGAVSIVLGLQVAEARSGVVFQERSFYGVLRVVDGRDTLGARRSLVSGRTLHGRQYLDSGRRALTTAYYGPASGVAVAIVNHPRRPASSDSRDDPFRVGVVGLGVGTLATYGRPGDAYTFYELDPNVVDIARRYFSFLADARAGVRIVVGDARLQLERELRSGSAELFDVLVVDAFTGDAVPVHLLTAECMALYLQRLKPDGLIAIHVSNRSLDLDRVVRGLAARFRLGMAMVSTPADAAHGTSGADWAILGAPGHPIFRFAAVVNASELERPAVMWTDDRSSIWEVFRLR